MSLFDAIHNHDVEECEKYVWRNFIFNVSQIIIT